MKRPSGQERQNGSLDKIQDSKTDIAAPTRVHSVGLPRDRAAVSVASPSAVIREDDGSTSRRFKIKLFQWIPW
jgi:hypothetical protein